jgi:hypothetical protein
MMMPTCVMRAGLAAAAGEGNGIGPEDDAKLIPISLAPAPVHADMRAMEIEVSAEAKDKRLNRAVAITVVALSVAMGLGNIKDGNIVQAMEQAKADSVDRWNEYQATRTKTHIARTARTEIAIMAATPAAAPAARIALAGLDVDIAKYIAEAPRMAAAAQGFADRYDALNVHDDQFDASEALLSTAISVAAVAALVESGWVLAGAWAFAAMGLFMSLCGFAGWAFHPDFLSTVLG